MSADKPTNPERGLPPVEPPSGRFIAQLFLVPFTIIFVVVLLLLVFHYLFVGGGFTAEQFLRQLDNPNADVRWRGASDLAQILEKRENLPMRADTAFALELASRLQTAVADLNHEEKTLRELSVKLAENDRAALWHRLAPQRKYVTFLAAATARFHAPVAIPALCELAQQSGSPDIKGETLLRRQALWAIGILGDNIRNFRKLPPEHQTNILAQLGDTARGGGASKAAWARTALHYLDDEALNQLPDGRAGLVEVDRVLARCAEVDDPYTRELAALALRFWEGDLVEPTIVKLSRDDGHGRLVIITDLD